MIKAVIFDLDDTLILEKAYIQSGYQVITEKIATDYCLESRQVNERLNTLFRASSQYVFNRFLDEHNLVYTKAYIQELIHLYRNHKPDIQLVDDAKEILTSLRERGYHLGIITDGYKETQRQKINALQLDQLVDYIIVTDELGREYWKPHEKAYQHMQQYMAVPFSEMVYVGDNIEKDFITAKKLGMKTIGIKREDGVYAKVMREQRYLPHDEITTLHQLDTYLRRWRNEENSLCYHC